MTTYRDENGSGDTTAWAYDAATGLLTQKLYADSQGPTYSYDALGRLTRRTWARLTTNNQPLTTDYSYDSLGQLTKINYSDGTPEVTFIYDRLGRQTQAITAGVCTN